MRLVAVVVTGPWLWAVFGVMLAVACGVGGELVRTRAVGHPRNLLASAVWLFGMLIVFQAAMKGEAVSFFESPKPNADLEIRDTPEDRRFGELVCLGRRQGMSEDETLRRINDQSERARTLYRNAVEYYCP